MNRRDFLKGAGGAGLWICFCADQAWAQETARVPPRPSYPTDFNAYLRIAPDGRVTCFTGKVELGQGAMTALAMLAAEELGVPLDRVEMVMGDTDLCPWDMGTFGSLSIWQFGPVLRGAAAEARAVLLQLAAERLAVKPAELRAEGGVISVAADPSKRVGYGELVRGQRIERHLDKVAPRPLSDCALLGRSAPRKDALEKVTGRARYAADQQLPGTLHACVLRPPAHGARRLSLDTRAAEKLPGVRVIQDGELVAALHEQPDAAAKALALVEARWERAPEAFDDRTVFDHLLASAPPPAVVAESGSVAEGEKGAASVIERTYLNAYVAHAPIETHSAVARFEQGKLTVWASTQAPFAVRGQLAQALGVPPEKVRVITPYVGGGFGGKTMGPQAVEAAKLARIAGRPVQVVWSREEEFFLDSFRPAAVVRVRSGLTAAGRIASWDFRVVGAGDREAKHAYAIPHQRITSAGGWMGDSPPGMHPFAVGPWRAPSANTNVFARESQIDLLAARAGKDPLAFRLEHLAEPRLARSLRAAADRFGWSGGERQPGRGAGIACAMYRGACVAALAEVAVDRRSGRVEVLRVVMAQDLGFAVNPDGVRQQMEGSIAMGLGQALTEEVRFRGGEVLGRNFDSYAIPRFSWMPRIETLLLDSPGVPPQGAGEPPMIVIGAVLANAVQAAAGVRLLQLPMTPERVRRALDEAAAGR